LSNLFDWNQSKTGGVHDQKSNVTKFNLNYNYILPNQMMVGLEFSYDNETIETKYASSKKITTEALTSTFALSVGYNFNEDFYNSWWLKGFLGSGVLKNVTEDSSKSPEKTTSDVGLNFVTFEFGKRFSLNSWGLKNFSYSPSLAIISAKYNKDADDIGLKTSSSAQLNVLKFDILF
jgi:hypothetical protein